MLARARLLAATVLLGGCTPAAASPTAAPPTNDPQHFVDADQPPEDAREDATDAPTDGPPPAVAPDSVQLDINQRYQEQDDPEQWAVRFEREGREVFDHRDEILAELRLREGLAVADVGAGTGLFTLAMAEAVGQPGRVYAVDVQAYFLDHIGQKARAAGLGNVELVRAQQDSVSLPPDSIDLALMSDVYHHIERPAPYLASLHAALREGGRLVVIDYRREEGKSSAFILEHIRASAEEFRAEIEGAGFRLVAEHEGILEENFFFEFEKR